MIFYRWCWHLYWLKGWPFKKLYWRLILLLIRGVNLEWSFRNDADVVGLRKGCAFSAWTQVLRLMIVWWFLVFSSNNWFFIRPGSDQCRPCYSLCDVLETRLLWPWWRKRPAHSAELLMFILLKIISERLMAVMWQLGTSLMIAWLQIDIILVLCLASSLMLAQKWLGHSVTSDDGVTKGFSQFGKSRTSPQCVKGGGG